MNVEWGFASDTGRVRENNEDSILVREEISLAVLCDGMGGHRAGEVASGLATASFLTGFETAIEEIGAIQEPPSPDPAAPGVQPPSGIAHALLNAAGVANSAVYAMSQASGEHQGMGCTLVALHLGEDRASFAAVGDSRLYLLRAGKLIQITEDHTRLRMLERMGVKLDAVDARRIRGVLTRAVGTHPTVEVDRGACAAADGDLWLLCSDGLTDELDDDAIRSILADAKNPRDAARLCVRRAVEAGGRDNVSVVVARVTGVAAAAGTTGSPVIETVSI